MASTSPQVAPPLTPLQHPARRDVILLFATRSLRLFGYGMLSVVLALYLHELQISDFMIGLMFSLTVVGDTLVSLPITTHADRSGRRRMLILGALLMVFAGVVFAFTTNYWLLLAAAIIGVISHTGNEIGPFLSIEQAALAEALPDNKRTLAFTWYALAGSGCTALGALIGGSAVGLLQQVGYTRLEGFRVVIFAYAALGALLAVLFAMVSPAVELSREHPKPSGPVFLGLHKSKKVVFKLSALFSLDAFAGGFVVQALVALWFQKRWGMDLTTLGLVFCGANILAGISAFLAVPMAKKYGLIETMVFTHIPSNVLLILVPLMPNLPLAIGMLLLRFSISQMDVPTRQAYTMAVVDPDERSAAAGITGVARSAGSSLSPALAGILLSAPPLSAAFGAIFYLSGGLKIVYDVLLYRSFRSANPTVSSQKAHAK